MLMDAILIFDQVKRQITAVAFADLSQGQSQDGAWEAAMSRIAELRHRMEAPLPLVDPLPWDSQAKQLPDVKSSSQKASKQPSTPPGNTSQRVTSSNW